MDLNAVAVEFDFVDPPHTARDLIDGGRQLGLDEAEV